MNKKLLGFVVILLLSFEVQVWAVPFAISGTNYPSDISAIVDFSYAYLSATSGEITMSITNTSDVASSLTGFAFNAPGNVTLNSPYTLLPAGWSGKYSPNGIKTPMQYGFFDIAGITGPNFNGGKTGPGIKSGNSSIFTLDLVGTAMDTLTNASFLGLFSDLGGKIGDVQYFAGRFQGIGPGGGSDVAIPINVNPVPEPGTMALLSIGLFGIVVCIKRRRNALAA